jgi:hypothetical protein
LSRSLLPTPTVGGGSLGGGWCALARTVREGEGERRGRKSDRHPFCGSIRGFLCFCLSLRLFELHSLIDLSLCLLFTAAATIALAPTLVIVLTVTVTLLSLCLGRGARWCGVDKSFLRAMRQVQMRANLFLWPGLLFIVSFPLCVLREESEGE